MKISYEVTGVKFGILPRLATVKIAFDGLYDLNMFEFADFCSHEAVNEGLVQI